MDLLQYQAERHWLMLGEYNFLPLTFDFSGQYGLPAN